MTSGSPADSSESDEVLMEAVRDRDCAESLELLIKRYYPMVQRICYRLVLDWQQSEDLAQDVFIRIYQARSRYRPAAQFKTFATTITLNRARDFLASSQNRLRTTTKQLIQNLENSTTSIPAENGEADVELQEESLLVRDALQELPEIYREVVVLRHYEDMKFEEIASMLEIPIGTAASRMAKALRLLAASLSARASPD